MKRKRHTEAQIIEKLRLAERLAAEGKSGAAIALQLEVESSFASLVIRANLLQMEKRIRWCRYYAHLEGTSNICRDFAS